MYNWFKKIISCSMVAVLLTPTLLSIKGNAVINKIIENPGFETGTLASWRASSDNWSITTDEKRSGKYSLKLTGTGNFSNIIQDISVEPNTNYIWTFYGKCTMNSFITVLKTDNTTIQSGGTTKSNNIWTKYTVLFNSGNNSTVRLYIGDGGGVNYFDDFNLKKPIDREDYKVVIAGGYSSNLASYLNSNQFDVSTILISDLTDTEKFNRDKVDCIILSSDVILNTEQGTSLNDFLKNSGDVIFLGESGWETGNQVMGLPIYYYYKTYKMWDLTGTEKISDAENQTTAISSEAYFRNVTGWSALAYIDPGSSESYPILNAFNNNGRLLGRAATVLAHYAGNYVESQWGLFGIKSDDYYNSFSFKSVLSVMLDKMSSNTYLFDSYDLNQKHKKDTRNYTITYPQPSGFVTIKNGVFIKPDGTELFLIGANYSGPICNGFNFGWGDNVNIEAIEADFKKAHDIGINFFRVWSTSYDNTVASTAVKNFARKYNIYLQIVISGPEWFADCSAYYMHLENTVNFWKDEPMVIGYDLANEPAITTIGGHSYDADRNYALEFKAYSNSLISPEEKIRVDKAVANNEWPGVTQYISGDYGTTMPGYTGGELSYPSKYQEAANIVDLTFKNWIDSATSRIKAVDPNHFITVGYNSVYVLLSGNESLDYINSHFYNPPTSYDTVKNNLTVFDRLQTRWGGDGKPISSGEFSYSNGGKMSDGSYLDPYTEAVGDLMRYLYPFSKGYSGAAFWQLNEMPIASMLARMAWLHGLSEDNKVSEERRGLFTYDSTYRGIEKPIAKAVSFFSKYANENIPGNNCEFNLIRGGTSIGASYEYISDNAIFVGATSYTSEKLSFISTNAANVMMYKSADTINIMSTADCNIKIDTESYGIKPHEAVITGNKGAVSIDGKYLVIDLFEGEALSIDSENTVNIGNPGFESGTMFSWRASSDNWSITTDEKRSGKYSLKLTGTGDFSNIIQDISVEPNTNYIWTFYGKCTSDYGAISVLKPSDNSVIQSGGTTQSNNIWTQYTCSFNSGNNSTVRLYIGDGGGINYFDDFYLGKLEKTIIGNPGFETGTFASWRASSDNWSMATNEKYSGKYSVKLTGNGDYCNISQDISVEPNTNYTWTFYGKCTSNYGAISVLKPSDNSVIQSGGKTQSNNIWTQYTCSFNSGDNSTVRLYIGDGGGINYFDDFRLEKTIIGNPGFETGTLALWRASSNNWSIATNEKRSGKYSLKLTGTGDSSNITQDIPVEPNTSYKWTFYGKCTSDYGAISVHKPSDNSIIQSGGTTKSSNIWTQYTCSFNSGNNSTVRLYIGDGGGINFFDDFYIEKIQLPFSFGKYLISSDNIITNVQPGTMQSDFKNAIKPPINDVVIKNVVSNNGIVGTGTVVTITHNKSSYNFVVKISGDVNGDGTVDILDLLVLKTHLLGGDQLSGAYLEAAKLNESDVVDQADFDILMYILLKK